MAAKTSTTFSMLFCRQLNQLSRRRTLGNCCISRMLFCSTVNEDVSSNPFYEKYANKIEENMTKTPRGFHQTKEPSNIYDNLLKREVEDVKTQIKKAAAVQKKNTIGRSNSQNGSTSFYKKKGLDAIMHLDKMKMESTESIKEVWREFHSDKDCISAVLPSSMYDIIQERAQKYPVFIYPVPGDDGYELMIGEFLNNQCYLTSVLNYQTLGENAPWLAAFTHFTELKESKGIVLMVGEIDTHYIATHEAMFITNLIQLYYGTDDENKLSLLKLFNTDPDKFDHMSVVREMERSTVLA